MSITRDVDYGGVTWEVEFNYTPGSPGCHTLRNGDPGYPDEPAEFEIIRVSIEGSEVDLTDYLHPEVLDQISTKLEEDYEPEGE